MNIWDQARIAAGVADPCEPHAEILLWATRLHCILMAEGRADPVASFDHLPEKDRAYYLARAARIIVPADHPLHPERAQ